MAGEQDEGGGGGRGSKAGSRSRQGRKDGGTAWPDSLVTAELYSKLQGHFMQLPASEYFVRER